MKRCARIVAVILVPPFAGTALFFLIAAKLQGQGVASALAVPILAIPTLFYASLVTLVPSAVYAASMEYAFLRGVCPRSFGSVLLAGGVGLTVGVLLYAGLLRGPRAEAFVFPAIGLLVGLLLGFIFCAIEWLDSRVREKA